MRTERVAPRSEKQVDKQASPLDVPSVDLSLSKEEIVSVIREMHARASR
jgi:hypothetical protein